MENNEIVVKRLVANKFKTPNGTELRSYYWHDYVSVEEDGILYFVDGGLDYSRHSGNMVSECVYTTDPFEVIRENLVWGTYGKNGDEPHYWKPLSEMTSGHIQAIFDDGLRLTPWRKAAMIRELDERSTNERSRKCT